MTILHTEAYLLAWLTGCIVLGLAMDAVSKWWRRRRLTRTAFSRIHLAGGVVERARRVRP